MFHFRRCKKGNKEPTTRFAKTATQQQSTGDSALCNTSSFPRGHVFRPEGKTTPKRSTPSASSLIPEILEEIFDICMSTPYRDNERQNQLAFSQVCRQWRSISLSFRRLWRTIDVAQPDLAKEFLVRSGTYPLRITSRREDPDIRLPGKDLKPHASRIVSFDISFRDHRGLLTLFGDLGSDLTELTSMSLKNIYSPNTERVHIDVPTLVHVKKLELHGVAIPWSHACGGRLTTLSLLGTGRLSPSVSQLYTILQSSPQLQHLSLQHINPSCHHLPHFSMSRATHPHIHPISLLCLDELILSSAGLAIYEILYMTLLPSTCRIHVTAFTTDGFAVLLPVTQNMTYSCEITTFQLEWNTMQLLRSSAEPWSNEPADARISCTAWASPTQFFSEDHHSSLDCSRFTTLELGKDCLERVGKSRLLSFLVGFINLETLRIALNRFDSLMQALSLPQSTGPTQLICPHLRKITFDRPGLPRRWVIDREGSESIVTLAHTRHRALIPLSVLELKQLRVPQEVISRLKGLIAEVYVEEYAGNGGTVRLQEHAGHVV